jgi:hypothetical protein
LRCNGIKMLTDDVVAALARHGGLLSLKRLETLSKNAERDISRHRGLLMFGGVIRLSEESAWVLSRNPNVRLPPHYRRHRGR